MNDEVKTESRQLSIPVREPTSAKSVTAFIPADFSSTFRFAELIAASGMAPKGMVRAEQIATAIFMGAEVGMTPMAALRSIAVINGRPSIWGDGALGLIRASGLLEDIDEHYEGEWGKEDFTAVCTLKRAGVERSVLSEFSIADAKKANLWTKEGPWQNYPKRMLQMRARAFALRDLFTDLLGGFHLAEELQDEEPIDITPRRGRTADNEPPTADETDDDGVVTNDDNDDDGKDAKPKRRGRPKGSRNKTSDTIEHEPAKPAEEKKAEPEAKQAAEESKAKAPDEPPSSEEKKPAEEKSEPAKTTPSSNIDFGKVVADIIKDKGLPQNPDEQFLAFAKNYLDGFVKCLTIDDARAFYNKAFKENRWTEDQVKIMSGLNTFGKGVIQARLDATAAGDEPPSAETEQPPFDYDGFRTMLDEELGKCTKPDDITRIFSDMTEIPLKEGVISEEQMENDLRPLSLEHMARVDF